MLSFIILLTSSSVFLERPRFPHIGGGWTYTVLKSISRDGKNSNSREGPFSEIARAPRRFPDWRAPLERKSKQSERSLYLSLFSMK